MVNTSLCYVEKDGAYLMLHRVKKKNDCNQDKYIGIGGHFEENESPFDCVKREVMEETGLSVIPQYRGVITFVSDRYESEQMHLFTATEYSGNLTDCDEGELLWVKKTDLHRINAWEGDYIFFDLLEKNEPFFQLKLVYQGDVLTSAELNGRHYEKEKTL